MNAEKQEPTKDKKRPARAIQNAAKDIDSQRHPEEQNVDPKFYVKKDEKYLEEDLNGSPGNQKI